MNRNVLGFLRVTPRTDFSTTEK